ncbi:5-oxoprolinase subunit PxpA [Rhodoglobus aureus]|uniref:5-oxoprolinase subunit PxpA n=1 Tax=Rhodoglobus aureus TaxID=191497 RepID=A0ABP4G4D4_9MICO
MSAIDLNSDLGEWNLDEEISDAAASNDDVMFDVITSANVAAGFHAGDHGSMLASARLAVRHGVSLGVHPSYRDRDGFGRRATEIVSGTLMRDIMEQVEALTTAASVSGTRVRYLKPHGALYNRIAVDNAQADAVALAAKGSHLPVLGLAGTEIHRAADRHGVQFFREAFVDRAYLPDGTLAPRSMDGAFITDPLAAGERAARMAVDGQVVAIDGSLLRVEFDSLCVHGDTEGAFMMAAVVRNFLEHAGLEIRAFV